MSTKAAFRTFVKGCGEERAQALCLGCVQPDCEAWRRDCLVIRNLGGFERKGKAGVSKDAAVIRAALRLMPDSTVPELAERVGMREARAYDGLTWLALHTEHAVRPTGSRGKCATWALVGL